MSSSKFKGAIFDLDGVVTQTEKVHFKAWKKTFDDYLKTRSDKNEIKYAEFTYEDDYVPYVDGKPRYQGVKSFLEAKDIELPYGDPADNAELETICGIGNKKNVLFKQVIEEEGIETYKSSISLIKDLKKRGLRIGCASSSMNARFILEKTGLITLFEVVIDGLVSKEIGLKGKPDPDIFTVASANLGLSPNDCIMVEDAVSGVQAGRNGNFALVLGVTRIGDKQILLANGADIVVDDLKEITYETIKKWFDKGLETDSWHLTYHHFEPKEERLREALTTVGNGYFGTRGCFESEPVNDDIHYPGTYIAGLYNKLTTEVHGKMLTNNDFVNCPNWLLIELSIGDASPIRLLENEILDYGQTLNMKDAILSRMVVLKDKLGRITKIETHRIASMKNPHIAAINYTVTPLNYSEKIKIKSTLDGSVINYGVARYRELKSKHLVPVSTECINGNIRLQVQTKHSKITITMTARNEIKCLDKKLAPDKCVEKDCGIIMEVFTCNAKKNIPICLEKIIYIYTSKDQDFKKHEQESRNTLKAIASFDTLVKDHKRAWHKLWDKANYIIGGDRFSQKVVRLHTYHLLVTASPHNAGIDTGMPARGLHGEAYRGHVFWDEIYILPFYNLHFPEITKALLMYRYNRLDAARQYAKENGYKGAMFPWQTADDGYEETQTVHYNPMSGTWGPDKSLLQRHVSLAIAYNVWEYYYCSNDLKFIDNFGVEIMLEIARFWASIAKYDKKDSRYHISGVMGPDEFHEELPGSKTPGLTDNAYTNIMVAWIMHKTIEMFEHLPEELMKATVSRIGFKFIEIERWKDIVSNMYVGISEDEILEQFQGYFNLDELDWGHYQKKYGNIRRMDRILKKEGDSPDKYKVAKQADVLMLFYLLSPGQVKHILKLMGYFVKNEHEFMKKNYDYYVKRTSHGSTLSHVVHAAILKYLNSHKKDMWNWYDNALQSDIYDTQGGTTAEGIHCGVMAGTIDFLVKAFACINLFKNYIRIEPNLPARWTQLCFKMIRKKNWIKFDIKRDKLTVTHLGGTSKPVVIQVEENDYEVKKGKSVTIKYTSK
ncbi:beta-phosphoglucomutase family hydrolase [Thermoproteota archaeon]